jgi:hypothetical protein
MDFSKLVQSLRCKNEQEQASSLRSWLSSAPEAAFTESFSGTEEVDFVTAHVTGKAALRTIDRRLIRV